MTGWETIAEEMKSFFPGGTARNCKEHVKNMLINFKKEDYEKLKK